MEMRGGRGALIVLEGIDCSGKTTQCERIVSHLKNCSPSIPAQQMRFPDRTTPIGEMIDKYLRCESELNDQTIHLLYSANRWELKEKIEATLNEGVTLIVDRYAYSGVAFSSSKEGLSLEWCKNTDRGLPAPDAVIFLDTSVEKTRSRKGFGEERYEQTEFQTRVMHQYTKLIDPTWVLVDASQSIEKVTKDILTKVKVLIEKCNSKPIKKLWVE